jgi:hypothetical protein
MSAYCKDDSERNKFEDYVTPGHPIKYRIHPEFLLGTEKISLHVRHHTLSVKIIIFITYVKMKTMSHTADV